MNSKFYIQLKAIFLLAIFGLNTVVGFACAGGMDMGFNTHHHQHEDAIEVVHVHADGTKYHHASGHPHAAHKHQHEDGKDDCCNDKVLKISQAEKAIPQAAQLLSPVFFTAFVVAYFNINVAYPAQVSISSKYLVLGHHPPIPDIRIAIQSFQI